MRPVDDPACCVACVSFCLSSFCLCLSVRLSSLFSAPLPELYITLIMRPVDDPACCVARVSFCLSSFCLCPSVRLSSLFSAPLPELYITLIVGPVDHPACCIARVREQGPSCHPGDVHRFAERAGALGQRPTAAESLEGRTPCFGAGKATDNCTGSLGTPHGPSSQWACCAHFTFTPPPPPPPRPVLPCVTMTHNAVTRVQ